MKRILMFTVFLGIFLAIYGGMNYYVFKSITSGFLITGNSKRLLAGFFVIMASLFLVSQFLKSKMDVYILFYIGALWLGILSISITILLCKDLIVFFFPHYRKIGAIVSIILIIAGTGLSIKNVLRGPIIKTVNLSYEGAAPLSIALLSDVHLGMMTSKSWLDTVIDSVNQLEADIIVFTGDLIDDDYHHVERFIPQMRRLKSKYGIYAISGNHEVYRGIENFHTFTRETGMIALDSKIQVIDNLVNIVGLEDFFAGRNNKEAFEEKLKDLLQQGSPDNLNLLLFHQPEHFELAAELGIDLQLSGHTHGGQIPPLNYLIPLRYKYGKGLYQYAESHIYTSTGTGTWGPPMRIFSTSEIVKININ